MVVCLCGCSHIYVDTVRYRFAHEFNCNDRLNVESLGGAAYQVTGCGAALVSPSDRRPKATPAAASWCDSSTYHG